MKSVCKVCGWDARKHPETGRSQHLRMVHNIDSRYKGAVKNNFNEPEETA